MPRQNSGLRLPVRTQRAGDRRLDGAPIPPAESIWTSITTGKTRAIPANASVPSIDTKYVSIRPTEVWTAITRMLGAAIRARVGTIGAVRRRRVRTSMRAPVRDSPTTRYWPSTERRWKLGAFVPASACLDISPNAPSETQIWNVEPASKRAAPKRLRG